MFAKNFSEVTVGMQLIGWIKNLMPYGVFVEFPYGLVGLAPKSVSKALYVYMFLLSTSKPFCLNSLSSAFAFYFFSFPGHDRQVHQQHSDRLSTGSNGDGESDQPG